MPATPPVKRSSSPGNRPGHLIGNHTYSHRNYDSITFEEFSAYVIHAGQILASDLSMPRLLRFPLLKEGNTAPKRDRMREFLATTAIATVTSPSASPSITSAIAGNSYDDLSIQVLGRSVPHTLLIHWNLLNSLFLADVLNMFHRHGWRVVNAEHALRDPIFLRAPKTVPAGESLLWALAKETGKFESLLRYPGEDDVYEKPKLDRLGV